jgi:ectoine hydroxylase-related dioxygenase (phytanoyl-CoA dioxygenase family)
MPNLSIGKEASEWRAVDEIKTHAVREVHDNVDEADSYAEEITNIGYTVVKSGLPADELQTIRQKIDDAYEMQVREIGGEAVLQRINDADLVRCIIGYDDYFLKLAALPLVMAVTRKLLGENFVLMSQNAIINRPTGSHYQFTWHRDLNYQHYVSSRPLAVSALYAIDNFTAETGGTWLIPASHKSELFPSSDYVRRHRQQITAPAGSILLFDAMIYHRAGVNRSGQLRRSVNHIYCVPMIQQQISLPSMLDGKFSDDPFLRMFLGYDTETGRSVQQWRTRKLAQAERLVKA